MKTIFILITVSIYTFNLIAQDVIHYTNGKTEKVKIINFETDLITYKIWEYQKAPNKTVNTSDVKYVKYSNGTIKKCQWFEEGKTIKYGSFIDKRDSTEYKTIEVFNQIWMAENLRATKTTDGKKITWVVSNNDWANLNSTDLGYCYYNNDPDLGAKYGVLYNWHTSQKVCPEGWHLPSDKEWTIFENKLEKYFVDDNNKETGGILKVNNDLWKSPNTGAVNIIRFNAVPGGCRISNSNNFKFLGEYANWWTSTNRNGYTAYYRYLSFDDAKLGRYSIGCSKSWGYSVRCIKN